MLTRQQQRLLRLIEERYASDGMCPSYDELAEQMGLASKSAIYRLVQALMERGVLEKVAGSRVRARQLKVIQPQTHLNPDYQRGYQDGYAAAMDQRDPMLELTRLHEAMELYDES